MYIYSHPWANPKFISGRSVVIQTGLWAAITAPVPQTCFKDKIWKIRNFSLVTNTLIESSTLRLIFSIYSSVHSKHQKFLKCWPEWSKHERCSGSRGGTLEQQTEPSNAYWNELASHSGMHPAFTLVQLGLSPQPPCDPERDRAVMNNLKKEMFHCVQKRNHGGSRYRKKDKKKKKRVLLTYFIIHWQAGEWVSIQDP